MSVQETLRRLEQVTGPDNVDDVVDELVSAYVEHHRRHRVDARLTTGEEEAMSAAGVDVDLLSERPGPVAALAAASTAVLADALTVSKAHELLGVSAERVRQRLRSTPPSLVGIRVNGGQWRLPAFQFAQDAAVANRGATVLAALPDDVAPQVVDDFFTRPNDVLRDEHGQPMSPTAWIADGRDLEPVVELAATADLVP